MRILIITARYLPHHGGLETVVREISAYMAAAGHQVAIVTNRYPARLPAHEQIDGLSVSRLFFLYPEAAYLRSGRLILWLAGWLLFPLTLIQLLAVLLRFRPDVVNVHYLGNQALFVWALHHVYRFRLVVSLHGGDVDDEPRQSPFKRWLFRAVLKQASRVSTCSQLLLDQALALSPDIQAKASVIHNGVDTALFASATPYIHKRPYLLGVGQLVNHKGYDLLISAFARLCDEAPQIDLLIAGDGPARSALQAQIESLALWKRACLLGAMSREQVASLMRGSLAIAIPSRRESFGIVGLEAMAAGRPIIASQIGGLSEALAGAAVAWFTSDAVDSLVESLRATLADLAGREAASKANIAQAEAHSWRAVSDCYVQVYQESVKL